MDHADLNALKDLTADVHCGNFDALKDYLSNGGDPNAHYGMSLLSQACDVGHFEMARTLLDAGANPNYAGKSGKLPLYIASKNQKPGNLEILELLIARGANVNGKHVNGSTPLLEAVFANDELKVSLLIRAGANILDSTNGGETGLHISAMKGNVKIMQMFLDAGVPVNVPRHRGPGSYLATGTQPLHLTVVGPNGGHHQVADLLLRSGADVNAAEFNGRTALHLAAIRNAHRVVDVLLDHGCDLEPISLENDERKTPLMKAIDLGHHVVVERLIGAGAKLDVTDHYGTTPLVTAVFTGKPIVVKLLIQAGCDVNLATPNGTTPFQASLRHPPHITEMLVLAGGRVPNDFATLATNVLTLVDYPDVLDWLLWHTCNPQSLQLLCRCIIRRALGLRLVEKLDNTCPMPIRIKEFLSCGDLDEVLKRYSATSKAVTQTSE